MSEFFEQYKRPEWQKKRLEVMNLAGFACQNCGDEEKTLNVHHKFYVKGRKVWEYDADDLECLCEPCHEYVHSLRDDLKQLYGTLSVTSLEQILGYARTIAVEDNQGGPNLVKIESYEQAIGVAHAIGFRDRCSAPSKIIDHIGSTHSALHEELCQLFLEEVEARAVVQ